MSEPTDFTGTPDADGHKDFTKNRKKAPTFTVGDNTYAATVGLPAMTMLGFAVKFGEMQVNTPIDQQVPVFTEIMDQLLEDDSAKIFRESMETKHPRNMIEIDQLQEIIEWLLGVFGLRPTQPLSPSAPGPDNPEPGTSLTGSTPVVELI